MLKINPAYLYIHSDITFQLKEPKKPANRSWSLKCDLEKSDVIYKKKTIFNQTI